MTTAGGVYKSMRIVALGYHVDSATTVLNHLLMNGYNLLSIYAVSDRVGVAHFALVGEHLEGAK